MKETTGLFKVTAKVKEMNKKTRLIGENIHIDILHDFTPQELKSMIRKGIEHFYRKEDYGKNFRQLISLYCEVSGIMDRKNERTEYGEVMFIDEPVKKLKTEWEE